MDNLRINVLSIPLWENLHSAEMHTVSAVYEVVCVKLKYYGLHSYETTTSSYIFKIEFSGKTYRKNKY